MEYSFQKGLGKGVVSLIIFAIPFLLTSFPEVANLTIGGLGVILVNFLKVRYQK